MWEGRFKSALVQDGYAARVMFAYIDLNPVRACMVTRPEYYKWCSYGEALHCRVRYFSDGMTFGSRKFVNDIFEEARECFGKKRKTGARPLSGVGWKNKQTRLYSMRQLVEERLELLSKIAWF